MGFLETYKCLALALERLSFGQSNIRDTMAAQSRILLFWYYVTYFLMKKNKPKYQQLLPPPATAPVILHELEPLGNDPPNTYQQSSPPDQGNPTQQIEKPPAEPLNLFELEGSDIQELPVQ
ncbi:hypothetical protein LIER_36993 [Lithospermum erythrorhizon]|uniref:Uncharacterized protein n=1 Tax=Lithospermum erythrorhizon TaxID=34254 RepID=A0AAV3PEX4_LITER